jgi:hypothetical protein
METNSVYLLKRLKQPGRIDGNWNKFQWDRIPALSVSNFMGQIPSFKPEVFAKLMYDDENIYAIFIVKDRFVRCLTTIINGPVWEDSCVEFFFSPDAGLPNSYFNLEVNCGGTPLMHFNTFPDSGPRILSAEDIISIEIAHSMPPVVDPELTGTVIWTLEYRIPLTTIRKYASVSQPAKGVSWKANFYKIAENNSNPHYMTWSPVRNAVPNFHLPQFFGTLNFQ